MTHLGCYFAPEHHRGSDRDYIAKLQPPIIRLLDPDVQQIADMHALCPNAIICPRTWIIDDNDGAAVRGLMGHPLTTAHDHANQYREQLDRWQKEARERRLALPRPENIYFNAANEPNQGGTPDKIAAYNVAFLNRCTELGIRAAALCLGVGWPDNSGADTPVNWQPYADAGLVEAIGRGQHWLDLHEYFYKSGPQDGWRWLAGRHLQCPFDVPILLGEIGIDNYVYNERWQAEPEETRGNRGWKGNVSPDAYADMIMEHIRGCDTRVVAALPFITDFRSRSWESFDTSDAHGALLARKDAMVPQAQFGAAPLPAPAQPQPVPQPWQGNPTAYILPTAGANLRSFPQAGTVLIAVPHNEEVTITGHDPVSKWLQVEYGAPNRLVTGWMRADLLELQKPELQEPAPAPSVPIGDNFRRCLEWVLKWEGLWADNAADAGGATMKGITISTFTRWRKAQGRSEPTKDELRAISDAELTAIYKTWYWDATNCDALPWPLCLVNFDTAVNAGPGKAQEMSAKSDGNFFAYMGHLIDWYARIDGFEHFGRAWMRRRADLLIEASK